MNESTKTKKALRGSLFALFACIVLLIGTTFAWFTDTASTGVNKIQAGNLKIAVTYKNTADGNFTAVDKNTNVFKTDTLWEPGHVEYAVFNVKNTGNLALKYKLGINIASETGSTNVNDTEFKLSDYINFAVVAGDKSDLDRAALVAAAGAGQPIKDGYSTESHLDTTGANETVTLVVWMPETVGNEANHAVGAPTPEINLGVNVTATQYTYESDSFGNDYDKSATYQTYPSGVTETDFDAATDVKYTDTNGDVQTGNKPAVAAYTDNNGDVQYAADIKAAVTTGATEIYCKKDADMKVNETGTNRTEAITKDLTIYGNGADFNYGEIALNSSTAGANTDTGNVDIKVYDAENIKIWGNTPADGVTWNIEMVNCHNVGENRTGDKGIMLYITGKTGTVNATVKNCYIAKNSSGIYMSTNGSLNVIDSKFVECATGIKTSFKGTGTRTDRIENCVFTNCGCTAEMAGDTAWLKDDSAAIKYKKSSGSVTLILKGNTISGTIGDKGDTQIASDINKIEE